MEYIAAISLWLDAEGLVGNKLLPEKWSTGNALTETGTAVVIAEKLGGSLIERVNLYKTFEKAIQGCKSENGFFNKNYNRRDEITHDDIIGLVAASRLSGMSFHYDVYNFGEMTGWVLSNTGRPYYTSIAKPWHIAFYKIAASRVPSVWEALSLAISLVLPSDAGGSRLEWLIVEVVKGKSSIVDIGIYLWKWKIKKKYGSIKSLLYNYYRDAEHPFVKYMPEDIL